MTHTILVNGRFGDAWTGLLRESLPPGWALREHCPEAGEAGEEAFTEALAGADAVLTMGWRPDYPGSERLRLIQLPGAGFDRVSFENVPPDCTVCNVFEHEIGMAEYVVAALLEWEIRISRMDAALREGRWLDGFSFGAPAHGELYGKTVGFIGYGHIASEVARRLAAFGVRTMARTRTPSRADRHVDDAAGMDRLGEMLEAAHYVVVACPLSDETRGLVDAEALSRMRDDAVVVNVARGEVIDEDALFTACRERAIGGAIIDTWYRYPTASDAPDAVVHPSRHPFGQLDNVIMTPHASGWTTGLLPRRVRVIAGNLARLAGGEPLRNVIHEPTRGREVGHDVD